jgi:hypothetical protein
MDVATYMAKAYPSPPCWALASDVLVTECGFDPMGYSTVSGSVRGAASAFRLALHKTTHGFSQIDAPQDFALVLMGKSAALGVHHCGIYYQGKVLHALDTGSLYQDLASLGDDYALIEFWGRE